MGSLDKTAKNVGTGLVGAPACGEVMKLQVRLVFIGGGNGSVCAQGSRAISFALHFDPGERG